MTDPALLPTPVPADALAPTAPGRPGLGVGLARWAVILFFLVNGLVVGGYAALLPSVRLGLGLTAADISLLLLCMGGAAVAGIQAGGRLADALGARRVTLATLPVLAGAMLVVGLSPSLAVAAVGATLIGLGSGTLDASASALAVNVEKAREQSQMGLFHGSWSVANVAGAALILPVTWATGLAGRSLVAVVAGLVAGVVVLALAVGWRITPETAVVRHVDARGMRLSLPWAIWPLALMAIAHGLAEGTSMDWSAMQVSDATGVSTALGSLGLVAVTVSMFAARVSGDPLVARFGRRPVIAVGGAVSAGGYLIVATTAALPALLLGWALAGAGVGLLSPQIYAAAGHMAAGRGLAVVLTFDYALFFVGPALVGSLVGIAGMAGAMLLPAALLVGLFGLAVAMPRDALPSGQR